MDGSGKQGQIYRVGTEVGEGWIYLGSRGRFTGLVRRSEKDGLIWEVGVDLQVGTEVGEGWIDLGSRGRFTWLVRRWEKDGLIWEVGVDLLSWYDLWISLLTLKSFQITRKSTRELVQKVGPDYSNCIFKLNYEFLQVILVR